MELSEGVNGLIYIKPLEQCMIHCKLSVFTFKIRHRKSKRYIISTVIHIHFWVYLISK